MHVNIFFHTSRYMKRVEQGLEDDDDVKVPAIKALADMLDCGQTVEDYRKELRKINIKPKSGLKRKILPSYGLVHKEKVKAQPDKADIFLTDAVVGVSMQKLLDLTVKRILLDTKILQRIAKLREKYGDIRLELYYKLGNVP